MGLLGPVGVVRRILRRFAVWIVLASLVYLTWWALDGVDSERDLGGPRGRGAVDVGRHRPRRRAHRSWLPLAADYTQATRQGGSSAFVGVGVGYFVAGSWMFLLGALLVLGRGLDDPVALPAAVAAAGLASALALLAVTVDETDEAFANIYSAAMSAQNAVPQVSQRALIAGMSVLATIGALLIDLGVVPVVLFLLGSFFVPLFGVLLADWLLGGRHYSEQDIFGAPRLRVGLVAAWIAGFALYQWIQPPDRPGGPSSSSARPPIWEIGHGGELRCPRSHSHRRHLRRAAPLQSVRQGPAWAVVGNVSCDLVDGGVPRVRAGAGIRGEGAPLLGRVPRVIITSSPQEQRDSRPELMPSKCRCLAPAQATSPFASSTWPPARDGGRGTRRGAWSLADAEGGSAKHSPGATGSMPALSRVTTSRPMCSRRCGWPPSRLRRTGARPLIQVGRSRSGANTTRSSWVTSICSSSRRKRPRPSGLESRIGLWAPGVNEIVVTLGRTAGSSTPTDSPGLVPARPLERHPTPAPGDTFRLRLLSYRTQADKACAVRLPYGKRHSLLRALLPTRHPASRALLRGGTRRVRR